MATKNKPYEQFGPYILFKKLESDSISELWRAAKLDGTRLKPTVALRRFTGGNRDAIAASAATASRIVPQLTGTSFVKQQTLETIEGTGVLVHEYAGGRSLRHIVEKGRGGTGVQPNPMPIDQAIVVAEKVALSLATTADLKFDGSRLCHGGLVPQFVWITDDGEIRVSGQQLGAGLLASMKDVRVASEYGRYFAPESLASGAQSKTADSYALGALLFLLVTGVEPPDAANASAFTHAIRAGKTSTGLPLPDDIRTILDKSLTLDPAARAPIGDLKQAISALANGGKYAGTTFNLAFYVSTLLKKELEGEALDRDRESKVNLAPFIEALTEPPARLEAPVAAAAPMFAAAAAEQSKPKSKAPLAIAAVVVLAAVGGGAFFMLRSPKPAAPAAVQKAAAAPAAPPSIVSQPLVAAAPATTSAPPTDTAAAEAAQKQAFEAAVQQKLQEEMLKLQTDYTKKLQQTQSKQAPVATTSAAPPAPVPAAAHVEEPSASQLDQQRLASRNEAAQTQTVAPPAQSVTQTQPPPPPVVAPPPVREGDIIDVADVDSAPKVTRQGSLAYPPIALRQKAQAMIIVTALVSENGDVLDAKILRGEDRYGFNDAALRAVRNTRFAPAMKDGKRVKTWFPVPVQFKQ